MDTARRVVAVLIIMTVPPAIGYWFVIHPLAAFWRKVGVVWTLVLVGAGMLASFVLLFLARASLLGRDLGTSWPLATAGIALYAIAGFLELRIRRHLTFRTLAGVPELAAEAGDEKFLDKGIYARIRHPRYSAFLVAMAGFAMFSNHTGVYGLTVLCVPALMLVARLEERELVERFGHRYVEYRKNVPAFIPRFRGRPTPARM